MLKCIISLLLISSVFSLQGKENPKIDRKLIASLSSEPAMIKRAIKRGDSYYKESLYDAAIQQYMRVFSVVNDHAPLNYKISVSRLYGVNPMSALEFFELTTPDVASDYYSLKGIALIYHRRFDEANLSFQRHRELLTPRQARQQNDMINRFIAISDFSAKAVQDSLPVFIINAGPQVNSYYDDFSAVELEGATPALYFTSRRPKDNSVDMESHNKHPERILVSPQFVDGVANEAQDSKLKSGNHLSVAGVDNSSQTGVLLYFRGKKRFGDVFGVQFNQNEKTTNNKRLNSRISKKSSKEGAISFTENGDAYFISDRFGGTGGKDIWFAERTGKNRFARPINMSMFNTPLDEACVFVTPDGSTLFFSSNGLPGMGGFDIYRSERQPDGNWGEPVNMGYPINSPDDDMFYRLTSDANRALISSSRSGGFGGLDIYFVVNDLRIPFEIYGNVADVATGRTLESTVRLFDRTTDMPIASAINDTIERRFLLKMEDIGDFYVQAEAPGYKSVTLDFTNPSVRHSRLNLDFQLEKLLHPYTLSGYITDVRTGRPVQAEIIIKLQGNDQTLYRTVSDAVTGFYTITVADKENFDLSLRATEYFDHNENLLLREVEGDAGSRNITMQRSVITYTVSGIVTSEEDATPLNANIKMNKPDDEHFATQEINTGETGKYEITITDAGPFLMEITAEGHFFANSVLQFHMDSTLVIRNFALKKMDVGVKMVVENILFNTGLATLRPESFSELNKVVNLLRENPTVRIEVSGHTDNVGSAATNRTLSRNRAMTVRNYLISQGIAGERVEYNGYGFDRPIAPNDTEDGRAENRRVEIEILN